jgi:transposase
VKIGAHITKIKIRINTLLKMHGIKRDKEKTGKSTWTKKYKKWLTNDIELNKRAKATLQSHLRELAWYEQEKERMEDELYELSQEPRYKEMVSELLEICGVGLLTAMVFLVQFGDMSRFNNRKEVGAYMGLVPASYESGNKSDRKGHITKQGSSDLRAVLCQAVWNRIKNDAETRIFYDRICRRNPKHKMIATVACMRKLGIIMWHKALKVQSKMNNKNE